MISHVTYLSLLVNTFHLLSNTKLPTPLASPHISLHENATLAAMKTTVVEERGGGEERGGSGQGYM